MHEFRSTALFPLEKGGALGELTIRYETYGSPAPDGSNIVWICHALTANAEVARWWPGLIGPGKIIDPSRHFIVCANILGSCYGTTGPTSINPLTGVPWYSDFPQITIRDMVKAHILLREHLGIEKIGLLMGGSMGGYQAMEWCILEPERIGKLFLVATSAAESPWGIAVHTTQRLAIEADPTWRDHSPSAGSAGLKAARAIGILSYRNYGILKEKQSEEDPGKTDEFKASSYIIYQGEKLAERFHAYCYWVLTRAMDSHNLARDRTGTLAGAVRLIRQPTLVVGIDSDILCPVAEQQFLADYLPHGRLHVIHSSFGHDGFMVEAAVITGLLSDWMVS